MLVKTLVFSIVVMFLNGHVVERCAEMLIISKNFCEVKWEITLCYRYTNVTCMLFSIMREIPSNVSVVIRISADGCSFYIVLITVQINYICLKSRQKIFGTNQNFYWYNLLYLALDVLAPNA